MIVQAIEGVQKVLDNYPNISGIKVSRNGDVCITTIDASFIVRPNALEAESYIKEFNID